MKRKQIFINLLILYIIFSMTFSILPQFAVNAGSTANYTGYVKDRNGRAIANAKVTLYSYGTQYTYDNTDSNGYYSFIGVPMLVSPSLKVTKIRWETRTTTVNPGGGSYSFYMYTSACALIVAGSTDDHFGHGAHTIYDILIDRYSYKASRVFLLTDSASYGGGITIPRDSDVSQNLVVDACEDIDDLTTTNDDVLIFWNSHGIKHDPWFGSTYYNLDCGPNEMERDNLDAALDGINCRKMLVMISSCYSGYFLYGDMDEEPNRALYSSSKSYETSKYFEKFTDGTTGYSYWTWAIILALYYHAGYADENPYDGRLSVEECMDYASSLISEWNKPQTPDSNVGLNFDPSGVFFGDQYR